MTYVPSPEERERGTAAIERIRRSLRAGDAAATLAAPPEPEPEVARPHEAGCSYCRGACWACEQDGRPLSDCRHELPARHGGGDLTNPPAPEPEADPEGDQENDG